MSKTRAMGSKVIEGLNGKWTKDEDAVIRNHYPKIGSECKEFLDGRSIMQIQNRAQHLGVKCIVTSRKGIQLKKTKEQKEWTKYEMRVLKKNYTGMGMGVQELLPDKTCGQIFGMQKKLKLVYKQGKGKQKYPLKPSKCQSHYYVAVGRRINKQAEKNESRVCDVFECQYCGTTQSYPVWVEINNGYTNNNKRYLRFF